MRGVDAFTNCVILDCMDSLIQMSDLIVKNIFSEHPDIPFPPRLNNVKYHKVW